MAKSELFKRKIQEKLLQNYKLEFLGNKFDKIISLISENQLDNIYTWLEKIISKTLYPFLQKQIKSTKNGKLENSMFLDILLK